MGRFDGKTAIVPDAAGGIGEEYAKALAAEGANVVVADVSADGGERVAAEISAAGGRRSSSTPTSPTRTRRTPAPTWRSRGSVGWTSWSTTPRSSAG